MITPVAVEKVDFSEQSQKLGDRKCLGDLEKSFVELPVAIQFLQVPSERVFQQPPLLQTVISGNSRSLRSKLRQAIRVIAGQQITVT